MKRLVVGVLVGLAVGATGAPADDSPNHSVPQNGDGPTVVDAPDTGATLAVPAGEVVRWRSKRLGRGRDVVVTPRLLANGVDMDYRLAPKTGACVAYAYGAGVALRLSSCEEGRPVDYVRARAVSAALKPVKLRLRFWAR